MSPSPTLGRLVADVYAAAAEEPEPPRQAQGLPARRKKLWEVAEKFHCPIVGTCLNVDELLRFARRFEFHSGAKDEYALHVEAVQRSMSRNETAVALHRHLERKYALAVRQFEAARRDDEVAALWKARLAAGDVAGPLWAVCTHRAASEDTRHLAYADVHMLSHQVGAGQAADSRRLAQLEAQSRQLQAQLESERKERVIAETVFRERIRQLETQTAQQQTGLAALPRLREQLDAYESGSVVVDLGRRLLSLEIANEQMRGDAARARELEAALQAARAQAGALARERDGLAEERDALERLLLPQETAPRCGQRCDGCDGKDRSGRCILCVGGRTALVAHYRALAERLGVHLVHHDGGQEEALSRLPELIRGADAVICPTDCVSHAAYYQLKRHCKLSGKPCLLFKGAGISSFALALTRCSSGTNAVSIGAPPAAAAT